MATTAERQRAYRQRAKVETNQRRINAWVSVEAARALARLAAHHQVSQREMLERVVIAADDAVGRALDDAAFEEYLAVTR